MIALAALLLTGSGASVVSQDGWGTFSARGARSRIEISVVVGTKDAGENPLVYWFRQTIKKPGQPRRTFQVNTEQCPGMLRLFRAVRDLPAPQLRPPLADDEDLIITADGVGYSLSMPAAYSSASSGDMMLTSNVGTPLAAWIDAALEQLATCQGRHAEPL